LNRVTVGNHAHIYRHRSAAASLQLVAPLPPVHNSAAASLQLVAKSNSSF
jgi:hypothetical protein